MNFAFMSYGCTKQELYSDIQSEINIYMPSMKLHRILLMLNLGNAVQNNPEVYVAALYRSGNFYNLVSSFQSHL